MSTLDEEEEENQEEESSSGSEGDEEDESEYDEEEEEPLLKYTRFAKDVINDLNQGEGEAKNVIECMAVHSKVSQLASL